MLRWKRNWRLFVEVVVTMIWFSLLTWQHNKQTLIASFYGSQLREYLHNIDISMEIFDFMTAQKSGKMEKIDEQKMHRVGEAQQIYCMWKLERPAGGTSDSDGVWQQVVNAPCELYLLSSYLDRRSLSDFHQAQNRTVQVLAMADQTYVTGPNPALRLYCQLWTSESAAVVVVAAEIREIWMKGWDPRNSFLSPILVSCPVPTSVGSGLSHVSVTSARCQQAKNVLPLRHAQVASQPRAHTVVCVKGMDFLQDISARLVEWFEMNYLLGADKVIMYTYSVHPAIAKVLEHYQSLGKLEAVPLTLPGRMPNVPAFRSEFIHRNRQQKRRNEVIPYNDCLYRSLYSHEYALIIDIDEVVVPLKHKNWSDMLTAVQQQNAQGMWTAFSARNAFFFDNLTESAVERAAGGAGILDPEIPNFAAHKSLEAFDVPKEMHMLRHPYRSARISPPGNYGKSFVYIPRAVTVFNHFPLHKTVPGLSKTFHIDPQIALKHHYKQDCPIESRDECPQLYKETVKDESLLNFKNQLIKRVSATLQELSGNAATSTSKHA